MTVRTPGVETKVKRPRPDVEALEAKRVVTNSLSLTPTIPFPALSSIILWDNAIMPEASTVQGGGKRRVSSIPAIRITARKKSSQSVPSALFWQGRD